MTTHFQTQRQVDLPRGIDGIELRMNAWGGGGGDAYECVSAMGGGALDDKVWVRVGGNSEQGTDRKRPREYSLAVFAL